RIFLRRLQRQRHSLPLEVDIEDLDLDLLPDRNDLLGMIYVFPRQLGDVHEPVDTAQIHESTEVDDRAHGPLAALTFLERLQEGLSTLRLRLFQEGAT